MKLNRKRMQGIVEGAAETVEPRRPNRAERRQFMRSMPRHIRLAYGFGSWRTRSSLTLRKDGRSK